MEWPRIQGTPKYGNTIFWEDELAAERKSYELGEKDIDQNAGILMDNKYRKLEQLWVSRIPQTEWWS